MFPVASFVDGFVAVVFGFGGVIDAAFELFCVLD